MFIKAILGIFIVISTVIALIYSHVPQKASALTESPGKSGYFVPISNINKQL